MDTINNVTSFRCETNDCQHLDIVERTDRQIICDNLKICTIIIINNTNTTNLTNWTSTIKRDYENEINQVPYIIWILLTIPFISIIVAGLFCAFRLKLQERDIVNNISQSTINGVTMEELLSQREILNTIAVTLAPPPTYEKATGEVPPGYDTVLEISKEQHHSIFSMHYLHDKYTSSFVIQQDNINGPIDRN